MRRILFICTPIFAIACGGGDSTAPASITGSYSLATIDGTPLPATFVIATGDTLSISSGLLVMNSDNTFTTTVATREDDNGTVTTDATPATGRWTLNSNVVTFTDPADPTTSITATVSGNSLAVHDGNFTEVFVKP